MHCLWRRVARLLLCVTLFTVFTPCFGWEAAGGSAPHNHAHGGHDQSMGEACPMVEQGHEHPAGEPQGSQHQSCAGHQLGHLMGSIEKPFTQQLPKPLSKQPVSTPMAFLTHIPAALERPPKHAGR